MRTAFGYVRVSTEEQADSGLGLEAQRQRIRAYCEMKGLHLAGVFEDPGLSGGKPLASRLAGYEELAALCQVMREVKRGIIEIALMRQLGTLADEELDLLVHLARESQRPVTWLALIDMAGLGEANEEILSRVRPYMNSGLRIPPQVSPRPIKMYYDLRTPSLDTYMSARWPGGGRSPAS